MRKGVPLTWRVATLSRAGRQSLITMKLEQEKGFLVKEEAVNIPMLEKPT